MLNLNQTIFDDPKLQQYHISININIP